MGINNPNVPSGAAWNEPFRTFYVSSGFPNSDGQYSTIQAAINAADGVNIYNIIIYPGTYTENLTLKANVSLMGWGQEIPTTINGLSTLTIPATALNNYKFQNLYFSRNGTAFEITGNNNNQQVIVFENCNFYSSNANAHGFAMTTNANYPQHYLYFRNCRFDTAGAGGAAGYGVFFNNPIGNTLFDKCYVRRFYSSLQQAASNYTNFFHLCECYDIFTCSPNANTNFRFRFHECVHNSFIMDGSANPGFAAEYYFHNCSVLNAGAMVSTSGNRATYIFFNCSIESTTNDLGIIPINSVAQTLYFYNSMIYNGRVHYTVNNVLTRFIESVIKNANGTRCLSQTAAVPTVFIGGLASDQIIDAAIVLAAGTFGNNTGIAGV